MSRAAGQQAPLFDDAAPSAVPSPRPTGSRVALRSRFIEGEDGGLIRRLTLPGGAVDSQVESRILPSAATPPSRGPASSPRTDRSSPQAPSGGERTGENGHDSHIAHSDLESRWFRSYLAGVEPRTRATSDLRDLRTVDLFCGAGGFALGVRQLAAETGHAVVNELAADVDEAALAVFATNHRTNVVWPRSVASLVDFRIRGRGENARFVYPPEILDASLAAAVTGVDLVTAGPPCQGHSNLNNRSRRNDVRNRFFLTVPAFAIAAGAKSVAIENVPAIVHARDGVVDAARRLFEDAGYHVEAGVLAADELGWPQTRRRYFMVARRPEAPLPLNDLAAEFRAPARPVWWAIGDLERATSDADPMTTLSRISDENAARIDFLFRNDELDLPDSERPACHRNGTTYQAVYGRMHKERPAPTITTGFMSPGRGRFVHPTRPRTLTPREAARLQGFPDTYRFVLDPGAPPTRHQLGKWIGDAVPMPLGYLAALSALGPALPLGGSARASEG